MRLPTEDEVRDAVYEVSEIDGHIDILWSPDSVYEVIKMLYNSGCFEDWRKKEPKENGHYRVMYEDGTLGSAYWGGAWSTSKSVVKWRTNEG